MHRSVGAFVMSAKNGVRLGLDIGKRVEIGSRARLTLPHFSNGRSQRGERGWINAVGPRSTICSNALGHRLVVAVVIGLLHLGRERVVLRVHLLAVLRDAC